MKNPEKPHLKGTGYQLLQTQGGTSAASNRPSKQSSQDYDFSRLFAVGEDVRDSAASRPVVAPGQDLGKYRDRVRAGRVKLCGSCGGIMKKSSRTVLSIPAGVSLIAIGVLLMAFYGYATNFYQVPWFVKFVLPASYYIGSIFMAFGVLFFFIRERVWKCERCEEMSKR